MLMLHLFISFISYRHMPLVLNVSPFERAVVRHVALCQQGVSLVVFVHGDDAVQQSTQLDQLVGAFR